MVGNQDISMPSIKHISSLCGRAGLTPTVTPFTVHSHLCLDQQYSESFDWNPKNPPWKRPQRRPSLAPIGRPLLHFSQLMTQLLDTPLPRSRALKHNAHAGMWATQIKKDELMLRATRRIHTHTHTHTLPSCCA